MYRKRMTVLTAFLFLAVCVGAAFWSRQEATAEPRDGKAEPPREACSGGLIGAGLDASKCVAAAVEVKGPAGIWERIVGPYRFVLRFDGQHVSATCTFRDDKDDITILVDADYGVTRDSVLFGVLTGVSIPADAQAELEAATLIDHAFSLRYRIDGDTLTLKDAMFDCVQGNNDFKELKTAVLTGRYRRKTDGNEEPPPAQRQRTRSRAYSPCVPTPTPTLSGAAVGTAPTGSSFTGYPPSAVPVANPTAPTGLEPTPRQ